jgi:hypothetical protein
MDASITSASPSEKSTDVEALRLTRLASLLSIVALSLGLWATIWAAIALYLWLALGWIVVS